MPANVDAVALVVDGLGDAADVAGHLEDDRFDAALLQKLIGGGQARGPRANDQCDWFCHGHAFQRSPAEGKATENNADR